MSIWEQIFSLGDRVIVNGNTGRVSNIRFDSNGDAIITVYLDDATATPDGFYVARDFELRRQA
jgi:hypothetical protein